MKYMDIMSLIGLSAVCLPLIFAVFLLLCRFKFSIVKKPILNNGLMVLNILSFFAFCACSNAKGSFNFEHTFLRLEKFSFNFGVDFTPLSLKMLAYCALTYFLITVVAKIYFIKKKQFYFTKQRFYTFLSFLIFNTYLFLISPTLFQMMLFWILQGAIIFCFSYFDIFKRSTSFNLLRFHRITLIGDFSFILFCLILLKYALLSQGYVSSDMLNLAELNILFSYAFGISSHLDLVLISICILLTIFSKMFILPFNCYYSFFANSSSILYLAVFITANSALGFYFLLKTIGWLELTNVIHYLALYLLISLIISAFCLLFEKNIKIIFGYIASIVNSGLIFCALRYDLNLTIFLFSIINILLLTAFSIFVLSNKMSFQKALIPKKKGFILEHSHIFIFEKVPGKICSILEFIDSKITQNILNSIFKLFSYLTHCFINNSSENSAVKNLINILIIFIFIALFAVLLTLFWGF